MSETWKFWIMNCVAILKGIYYFWWIINDSLEFAHGFCGSHSHSYVSSIKARYLSWRPLFLYSNQKWLCPHFKKLLLWVHFEKSSFTVVSQDKECCLEAERSTHVHPGVCCLSALKWTAGKGWVCTGTWCSLLKRRWWEQTPTLLSFCVQFHFINER